MKKGQMKIQQMAFMLVAVILFFALVTVFIIAFRFSGLRETATLIEEENALLLVSKLADSPEFSCGDAYGTTKSNCVDFEKVMVLKRNINRYSDFWGVSGIEVKRIYPEFEGIECNIDNYPDCDTIEILSGERGIGVSNFVSLCRKDSNGNVYDRCDVAKLIVSYEIR